MKKDIHTEIITYTCDGVAFKGFLAAPIAESKAPGIIIAPTWKGLDDFARKKAVALAELGYVAMAADLYGDGKTAADDKEAGALMMPLFLDRALLRKRMQAALEVLQNNPLVDEHKMGAIGFCFGGLCVIELLRSGAHIKGVVSFHGILGDKIGEHKAHLAEANQIVGKLLILHGHDDPLVSAADISAIQKEMTDAKVDWQMNIYGHTSHAFTNPEANDSHNGLVFNPCTDRRSWQSMRNFFEEILT